MTNGKHRIRSPLSNTLRLTSLFPAFSQSPILILKQLNFNIGFTNCCCWFLLRFSGCAVVYNPRDCCIKASPRWEYNDLVTCFLWQSKSKQELHETETRNKNWILVAMFAKGRDLAHPPSQVILEVLSCPEKPVRSRNTPTEM